MKKLLMIPGPTPVVDSIRAEMARDTIAFGDPVFIADFKEVLSDLKDLWQCDGEVFVVAGSGTLAMEMALANNLKKGDKYLLVSNGFFGDRFIEIAERKGLELELLQAGWGQTVTPEQVEAKLQEGGFKAVSVTQVDTSTGVLAPVKEIGEVVTKFDDVLYIVDGVCSVAGEPVDMTDCKIDVLFTGSQKAFGVAPGLMMLWANQASLKRRDSLGQIVEYYCDYHKWLPIMQDPSKYFATPPINLIWALKESVRIIKEETLEKRYQRHEKQAVAMQAAFEALGFEILAEKPVRAHTLSNLIYPEGIDDLAFRTKLAEEGVQAAGGVGKYAGKMLRIGHMGNADTHTMVATIAALERTMKHFKSEFVLGSALTAYHRKLD